MNALTSKPILELWKYLGYFGNSSGWRKGLGDEHIKYTFRNTDLELLWSAAIIIGDLF